MKREGKKGEKMDTAQQQSRLWRHKSLTAKKPGFMQAQALQPGRRLLPAAGQGTRPSDSSRLRTKQRSTTCCSTKQRSTYAFLMGALLFVFAFSMVHGAFAAQLPLPIDAATKAGLPSFVLNSSDLIGDRGEYANPSVADLDADGDYDIVLGLNNGLLEWWRNDGSNTAPLWVLANGSMIGDYADQSSPTLTDFDNDGDFDLFVGYGNSYLYYFQNTGTPQAPSFTYVRRMLSVGSNAMPEAIDYNKDGNVDMYYGRENPNIYKLKNDVGESGFDFNHFYFPDVGSYSSVFLADVDADGDFDAFIGGNDGNVWLFKNLGGSSPNVFGTANKDYFDSGTVLFDVGSRADPTLADLDADGDLDLLIGKSDGTFTYYRNDGTARNAFWTLVPNYLTADAGDNAAATLADLDNDADLDLVIGNNAGFISYYVNEGTPQDANFVLSGSSLVGDVGTDANPELRDLDNDGKYDLAVGRSDGIILFYRNTGTPISATFTAAGNVLDDYIDYTTPSFADLDGDGDLDLATGAGDIGGWVSLIENTGSLTNFSFSNKNTFWFDNTGRGRTPDFADFDKDGDQDMVIGQEDGYVYYFRNDGTAQKPSWASARDWIGDWGSWTSPSFGDLNNDGEIDFILGGSDFNVFYYFKNDVLESGFNFVQNTSDLIGDIGSYADPKFADMDADGDFDLFIGTVDGRVRYYKNIGSAQVPIFVSQADPIPDQGDWTSITTGDLDADEDLDLLLGTYNDQYVRYYRNTGNATNFNFVQASTNLLNSYCRPGDGNSRCTPELVDLDNDGDLDLLVSLWNGYTRYWRNDGTPTIAVWSDQGDIIGNIGTGGKPTVADLDYDGDKDVLLGRSDGMTFYYKNTGSATSPSFTSIYAGPGGSQYLPNQGNYAKPAFADLNNDGNIDVAVGLESGLTALYFNQGHWQTSQQKGDNPTWIYQDSNLFDAICEPNQGTGYCNGELVDIDNDGDLDVVGGNYYYGPRFWENVGNSQVYSFLVRQTLVSDYGDSHDTTMGDFDNDGDLDMMIGYSDGRVMYFKNVGTAQTPSFTTVYRGDDGSYYLTDLGDYARVGAVDINNDGLMDLSFTETNGPNEQYFLRNKGVLADPVQKARDTTWVSDGIVLTNPANYNNNKPSAADVDGDGDIDLVVGDEYERLLYYRNEGTHNAPNYVLDSVLFDFNTYYARPALLDYDGDGDFDLLSGRYYGLLQYITNRGSYATATTLTLKDQQSQAIVAASVVFSDDSGIVCSNQTDAKGQVRCPITFVGSKGRISVTGGAPGTATLGVFSPNSRGNTYMTLQNPASTFSVDLARFLFQTYGLNNVAKPMHITVQDGGTTLFSELTQDNGFIDGFFPQKYLENRQEPFTQNRIQYDVTLERNNDYASDLDLDGVFVPNEINFNGDAESTKLYKFISAHQMSTDAEYKGFIIYPALTAQRAYHLADSVPTDFTYAHQLTASYLGQSCAKNASSTSILVNSTDTGCSFLANPVQTAGDWVKYEFTVRTPSLDLFIMQGLTNQSYSFPAAQLSLIS
ncbi:MAG: VCBS repeat-containing protein [Nanoarchaeota archaeon]